MRYIRQFIICFLFLFIISTRLYSGLVIMWTQQYDGGNGNDEARDIAVDNSGYVYVTGSKDNGPNDDYFTIKYSNNGATIWTQQYDGGNGNDRALGIAVDNSGYVYVTGFKRNGSGDDDYFTIKYSNNGATIWTQQYDGGIGGDSAYDIAVDNSGYIYVTGAKFVANSDYFTIKYSNNGSTIWTQQYNCGTTDESRGIVVDNYGYVYVTGIKSGGSAYFTVKYSNNGNTIWTQQCNEGTYAFGMAVDNFGYVYVTGVRGPIGGDFFTIKYDSNGNTIWTRQYDIGNSDRAYGVTVDNLGYVYVTGEKYNGSNSDYFTIKYDSNGNIIWTQQYDGGHGHDDAKGIAVDNTGYVYMTGFKRNGSGDDDYFTIKYLQPPYPDPSSLSASAVSDNTIKLIWQDNTINESGFKIYQSEDGVNYDVIGITSTDVAQFMDTSISSDRDYWYKVTATNKAGETAPSNIAIYKMDKLTEVNSLDEIVFVPNPFNPHKSKKDYITFFNVPDDIKIEIYNILGEKLRELSNPDSEHRIKWYGKNSSGKLLSRGFYIARLEDSKGNKRHIKFVIQR